MHGRHQYDENPSGNLSLSIIGSVVLLAGGANVSTPVCQCIGKRACIAAFEGYIDQPWLDPVNGRTVPACLQQNADVDSHQPLPYPGSARPLNDADACFVGATATPDFAVTTFFHAPNTAAVSAALVLHAVSFLTSLVPGMVIMAIDGLSVAGLGRLAGAAKETAGTDEMPVLRTPGR